MTVMTEFYFSNAWILLFSGGWCLALISVLALCLCGCRKGAPKNDLLGLDGMVKITNPDENVNHIPVGEYVSQAVGVGDPHYPQSDDLSKRPSGAGGSNPHRSLPDIPVYAEGDARIATDTELYATVDDKIMASHGKRHTMTNGIQPGPSLSHQSSISQADSNYARLKENPYDKVKRSENPYANVQSTDAGKDNDTSRNEECSRGGATHGGDSEVAVVGTTVLPTCIGAAVAVAGRVAASPELPYMTPPVVTSVISGTTSDTTNATSSATSATTTTTGLHQQHFSGDSVDSSRGNGNGSGSGYTSISVREPIANIRGTRPHLDPHYSTVSDDSDEMYAAIVEPNVNMYTNGSETYAQIQPPVHEPPDNIDDNVHHHDDEYELTSVPMSVPMPMPIAPQPPSVDSLKHVAHVHSRQASSSSCTSSVANLGSPKPEKRQANSPLPPPPPLAPAPATVSPDEHGGRAVEDMYAKVHKNKKKSDEDRCNASIIIPNSSELVTVPFHSDSYSKKSWSSRESFEEYRNTDSLSVHSGDLCPVLKQHQEHCYETLNKNKRATPNKQNEQIDGYENIRDPECCEMVSVSVGGPESLLSNDPGYEQVNQSPSYIDPKYEVLLTSSGDSEPKYESVKYVDVTEPPYERLHNDTYTISPPPPPPPPPLPPSPPPYNTHSHTVHSDIFHV